MKIKEERKFQNGGHHSTTTSNGSTIDQIDSTDLELQKAFEDKSSSLSRNDSISPMDTIAFNIEGIQTVVKNSYDATSKSGFANGVSSENLLIAELQRHKEENIQLKAALKEASKVNQQWRNYHEHRQGYVQKLLSSLQELQQSTSSTQEEGKSSMEFQRLKEMFSRQQKEHNEHIQLLQLQVRAHRDDWEAERTEKKAAEIGRIQAEAHLQILQRQLKETTIALAETDARLKLCKCFAASIRDQISPNERRYSSSSFQHPKGQLTNSECLASQSNSSTPTFSSTNSSYNSTSRSSSVSKDFSSSSSPTITKSLQPTSSQGQNSESNRTLSPSMRIHISKSSSKCSENQEKSSMEKQSGGLPNSAYIQQEEIFSRGVPKAQSNVSDHSSSSKSRGKDSKDTVTENSLQYYESKGARPKIHSSRGSDDDERKAKHRARSILASALPMSPSSSKPSSPVTVLSGKGYHVPKGYIPLTSTVLTQSKNKNTLASTKATTSKQLLEDHNSTHRSAKPCMTNEHVKSHHHHHQSTKSAQISAVNVLKNATNRTSDNLATNNNNDEMTGNQCHAIEQNNTSNNNINNSKNSSQCTKEETKVSKDLLVVKTACRTKQNARSLTVTNSHQEKLNANYASITVMPSPSSALFSHTQSASTTSSRSSSPGISLTTFALNANGQGVPGAIFFALGPEPSSKLSGHLNKDSSDNEQNERIVNSTYVQLTDNESNSKNLASRTHWRTARAIPSHKLNSVRKHNSELTSKSFLDLTIPEERKKNVETSQHRHNKNKKSSDGMKHLKIPQPNYETRYHTSFSPPPSYTFCSPAPPRICEATNPTPSENVMRSGNSPTICIIPSSNNSKHDNADLRTMASRNISSAILSYECASKGSVNPQCMKNNEMHLSGEHIEAHKSDHTAETRSKNCLICPSCQKLYSAENSQQYTQHIQMCGGPKYADM